MKPLALVSDPLPPAGGRLLVAAPMLTDPNFAHSVVLLLEMEEESGALGVVLDRPGPLPVHELGDQWGRLATDPARVFAGGPVGEDRALTVVSLDRPLEADDPRWRRLFGRLGVVDLDQADDDLVGRIERLRVFGGYAGWGAGQLEDEIAEGAWYVVEGRPEDPFVSDPTRLRGDVLRRQDGPLRWLATCPADVALN